MTTKTSSSRWAFFSFVVGLGCDDVAEPAGSASGDTAASSTGGPEGQTCNLPKTDVRVVDLSGIDTSQVYVLMSDGSARFWGGGYPFLEYVAAHEGDEPCLTSLDVDGGNALGMSHQRSITLIRGDEAAFDFDAWPITLELSDGGRPIQARAGREFVVLDEAGAVWVLEKRLTQAETEGPYDRFEKLALPDTVKSITGTNGYCALGTAGKVYCVNPLPDYAGRFGMGLDVVAPEPTELPIEEAKEFVLGFSSSCWLDQSGLVSCAGMAEVTGYPRQMFENYRRPYFDLVPGAPPLVHLEIRQAGVCGFTAEGELWCWGSTYDYVQEPEMVGFFPGWKDLTLASQTVCVLDAQNHVYCLGANAIGDPSCEDDPFEFNVFHRIAIPDCED